ncbi:MFS transporter [Escherichia coli]
MVRHYCIVISAYYANVGSLFLTSQYRQYLAFWGASTDEGTWVITSFGVANAIAIPVTGRLAQRIGQLRLFLLSVTFFSLLSLMCSLSTNLDVLIFFRVVQD